MLKNNYIGLTMKLENTSNYIYIYFTLTFNNNVGLIIKFENINNYIYIYFSLIFNNNVKH